MTTATWIIGLLELLSAISSGMSHNWVGLATSLAVCILFLLTVISPKNFKYRKTLYIVYLVLSIGFTVVFAAAVITLSFSRIADDTFEEACRSNTDLYPGKYPLLTDCVEFLHKIAIFVSVVMFCIAVPVRFALARVLYYGYKEQHKLHTESENLEHAADNQHSGTTG